MRTYLQTSHSIWLWHPFSFMFLFCLSFYFIFRHVPLQTYFIIIIIIEDYASLSQSMVAGFQVTQCVTVICSQLSTARTSIIWVLSILPVKLTVAPPHVPLARCMVLRAVIAPTRTRELFISVHLAPVTCLIAVHSSHWKIESGRYLVLLRVQFLFRCLVLLRKTISGFNWSSSHQLGSTSIGQRSWNLAIICPTKPTRLHLRVEHTILLQIQSRILSQVPIVLLAK